MARGDRRHGAQRTLHLGDTEGRAVVAPALCPNQGHAGGGDDGRRLDGGHETYANARVWGLLDQLLT